MTLPLFPAPPGRGWPLKRTSIWKTLAQPSIGGQETRLQVWSYPKWRYELTFDGLRSTVALPEWQALAGLFNQVGGSAGFFAFNDALDNAVTAQAFGTGDGATTAFQLVRTLGGVTEPVYLPAIAATTLYANGVLVAYGSGAGKWLWGGGIDVPNGVVGSVVFGTAPSAGVVLTWTGTYTWMCQFDSDEMPLQQDMYGLWSLKSCIFTTVKL